MLYLLSFLILIFVIIALLLIINPAFGGNLTKEQKELYQQLNNYSNGEFFNEVPTNMYISLGKSLSMIKEYILGAKGRNPDGQIPVDSIDWNKIKSEKDSLTWFGHSAFLISIDNKNY